MPDSYIHTQSVRGKRHIQIISRTPSIREKLTAMLHDSYVLTFLEPSQSALVQPQNNMKPISLILLELPFPNDSDFLPFLRIQITSNTPILLLSEDGTVPDSSLKLDDLDVLDASFEDTDLMLSRIQQTIELAESEAIIRSTERDSLTGLYNRDYFFEYSARYIGNHGDKKPDALVIDINHFHMINERYGQEYGNTLLTRIGAILRQYMDQGWLACRHEADTFLVCCPHHDRYDFLLKELMQTVADRKDARIRMRIGIYSGLDQDVDIERRFDHAKLAADVIRHSFTTSIYTYNQEMHDSELLDEQLLDGFENAIAEKQFQVYLQPKFNIQSSEPVMTSAEALVRWIHPTLGTVKPTTFIPLFENNGLIRKLDSYVWHEAAAHIRRFKDTLGISVPVSVNISRVDMYDTALVENIEGILNEFSLSHDDLLLEITESTYTEDSDQLIDTVMRLRGKGFHIEMDDFGTGYSSLNMISTLPIDALKLDMQFIRNAFKGNKDTRLLELVIDLADSLGIPTIAEGVETMEQMHTLKTIGCDIVQGYYFSKPLPADTFAAFLLQKKEAEQAPLQ